MSSKSVPRIVPWLSASEWRETRRLLFSNRTEDIRLGILKAKIWMDRGKVPTAVESTVNFLETVLVDTEHLEAFLSTRAEAPCEESVFNSTVNEDTGTTEAARTDDRVLRLAYNAAIIRFVNELVDRAQKSLFATSITKLADQIGLPRFFVDIRHDGTHDKMNSLELLRWAAWEALKWLEDQYWSIEDDLGSGPEALTRDFNAQVHGLLKEYCDQIEKINDQQSATSLEKSSQTRIINQIDFLQTLPRIMKSFLLALCEFKRPSTKATNVLESIIRPLARNNWDIFCPTFIEILLERRETDLWLPWIIEEIKKSPEGKCKMFTSNLLVKFSEKSSADLFKEKIVKIAELLGEDCQDSLFKKIYPIFDSVYNSKLTAVSLNTLALSISRNLIKKRRYVEDENLEGWTVVSENWRPCPLGSFPK